MHAPTQRQTYFSLLSSLFEWLAVFSMVYLTRTSTLEPEIMEKGKFYLKSMGGTKSNCKICPYCQGKKKKDKHYKLIINNN